MARPTVMTKDVIDKLEYAFSLGCSDNEACLHADISPATLYNHQEKYPEFLERKTKLKDSPIFIARETVIKGMKRDPKLALEYLTKKKRDEFGNTATEINIHMPQPILGAQSRKVIDVSSDDSNSQAVITDKAH